MTLERKAELAQQTFRRLMDSMAKPGTINELPDDCELTQGELTKGLGAVINTFLDHEVSYSLLAKVQ